MSWMTEREKRQFGQGLKNLMENEQITVDMLSEWTGICKTALRNYRAGRACPQPKQAEALRSVLRMSAEEIAQVQPAPKPEPVYRSVKTDAQYSRWFSAGIRTLMRQERLSARELARMVGVKPDTLRTWTVDERSPKLANALQIAEVFRTTIEDIVCIGQRAEEEES